MTRDDALMRPMAPLPAAVAPDNHGRRPPDGELPRSGTWTPCLNDPVDGLLDPASDPCGGGPVARDWLGSTEGEEWSRERHQARPPTVAEAIALMADAPVTEWHAGEPLGIGSDPCGSGPIGNGRNA